MEALKQVVLSCLQLNQWKQSASEHGKKGDLLQQTELLSPLPGTAR